MRRPLYGWLASEAVSITGTRVSMIALPFFVLGTTGSAQKAGLVALAEMLPLVLMRALGGPVIDRLGARRVSIACDLASVVVLGAIPLLHAAGRLPFPVFLALVALAGALRGPGDGAKHALAPTLVAHAGVPMERATGLHSTVERTASMLGAALAGALVAVVGPANALLVDAASFALSALLLAWSTATMAAPAAPVPAAVTGTQARGGPAAADHAGDDTPGFLQQLREGWTFLRGDRVLVGITVMLSLTNMLDIAYATVLVPVWGVQSGGGAAVVGLLFAVFSGASALGAVCAAAWAAMLPRYWTYLLAFLVCGAPRFFVLAFDSPVWGVLAVAAVGGFAAGFINPVLGAVVFERIPAHLVGRVTSLSSAAGYALMPFGGILAGVLVGSLGLTSAMVALGVAYFAFTMLPVLDPSWRGIERGAPPAQRPASLTRSASRKAREMAPPSSATSTST